MSNLGDLCATPRSAKTHLDTMSALTRSEPARLTEPHPMAVVREAADLRKLGQTEQAVRRLRAFLDGPQITASARVEGYFELGRCYDELGRRRDAQACFRRILALSDDWNHRERARRAYRNGSG